MRLTRLLMGTAVVTCGLMTAAVPAAQEYPHAFPRTGVTQLFDNARVTVWEVNWIHGAKAPIHRHRYDMAGVYLRYGEITVTRPDGTATKGQPFEVPRPYFQPKDITHREEAQGQPGDPERLAIMVDLKDTPVPMSPLALVGPTAFPRAGATNVLENPRVRMWDYSWTPGAATSRHTHDTDTIEVFVTGGSIRTRTSDGSEETHEVAFKTARWVPRGRVDTEEAIAGSPRAIVIEIK